MKEPTRKKRRCVVQGTNKKKEVWLKEPTKKRRCG